MIRDLAQTNFDGIEFQQVSGRKMSLSYFPMQDIKCIDNQRVTLCVVQMWFKFHGNNFHVAGTKKDLDSLR